ncbi:heavy metal translocating P-type ATPase [Baekduia sp. Peel2402]|uniref:heavy metal translocating P-type ATPase n=1 Tax=Baekduia sp. Peel2402 TaxID=3458296 RepID=UPI00403EB641
MSGRAYVVVAGAALAAIVAGLVLSSFGYDDAATALWTAIVVGLLLPLVWSVLATLRRGRVGVDAIALIAMAGALALGEELAGAVIALMLAGGNALEAAADRRARRELTALLAQAPRTAHVHRGDRLEDVEVEEVMPGEMLIVRRGEIVPVDGLVASGEALVDEAALTGEPMPVAYTRGEEVRSGVANAGAPFDLRTLRSAGDSAYAALVQLVAQAQADRAPFTRLADRYAALLLPVTLVIAGAAWAASGDAVRALAVVVVATPCPLILAAPIALTSGISRAAAAGVVVKGASVVEQLGRVRAVLLDKTGTLTLGTPRLVRTEVADGDPSEALRLAASLDQMSAHPLAAALVRAAGEQRLALTFPVDVQEAPGEGIVGSVDGRRVAIGRAPDADGGATPDGERGLARVGLAVDGVHAATFVMGDRVREDAAALVQALRDEGVGHIAMVTGDRSAIAEPIGVALGLDAVHADCTPEGKLEIVRTTADRPVMMVGDGVNDAPALALADVGVAMVAAGGSATAASEAADAVIVSGAIGAVAAAVRVGRGSLAIATQSVVVGMGLSFAAMAVAAVGALPPVAGALLQEGIDVAVILNALRARRL